MSVDVCSIVRRNFYCSYMLEGLVVKLLTTYLELARPMDDFAEVVLRAIAFESKRHTELMEFIARRFGLFEQTRCEYVVGEPWHRLRELLDQLTQGVRIDLKSFIEKQMWLERAVGEETYQKILLPLILQAMRAGCMDSKAVEAIEVVLDKIVDDEKWHEKMLRALYGKLLG